MPRAAMSVATSTRSCPRGILQRALARILRLVAVNRSAAMPGLARVLGHPVGAVLGAGEDDDALDRVVAQKIGQQRALVLLLDE